MTDDERRQWLASLRPGGRVAVRPYGQERYRHGCTLISRWPPFDWRPGEPYWDIAPDYVDDDVDDIESMLWPESELEPLPYPGMTGVVFVGPPLSVLPGAGGDGPGAGSR